MVLRIPKMLIFCRPKYSSAGATLILAGGAAGFAFGAANDGLAVAAEEASATTQTMMKLRVTIDPFTRENSRVYGRHWKLQHFPRAIG